MSNTAGKKFFFSLTATATMADEMHFRVILSYAADTPHLFIYSIFFPFFMQ